MFKVSILLMLIFLFLRPPAEESVRAELIRQQEQTGLTLASFYRNLATENFASRSSVLHEHVSTSRDATGSTVVHKDISIPGVPVEGAVSRDGEEIAFQLSVDHPYRTYLAINHPDGTGLREYPNVDAPTYLCWSYDKSKLAASASDKRKPPYPHRELLIVDLRSDTTEELLDDERGYLTSQCWSPDGTQIVYGLRDAIWIFDLKEKKRRELTKGGNPTWSPDGNSIAFVDRDAYYVIRPNGTERKLLFKSKEHTRSGLWWSPDGRMVAYISLAGHWFRHTDFVARQLRVRRLADESDDWLVEDGDVAYIPSYQWVQPSQSVKAALNKP